MPNNPIPDFITWAAQQQQLDPNLVRSVIQNESGGNAHALSPKGASGLMQLMPGTAKDLGVNPADPVENVMGGISYLGQMNRQFGGDTDKMLAAYNFGPGHVSRGDPYPKETTDYIQRVHGSMPQAQSPSAGPAQAPPDFFEWAAKQQPDQGPAPSEPDTPSVGGFLSNVATSGAKFVENTANTIMHPLDTAKSLGRVALGVGEKFMPGDQPGPHEHYANDVGKFYSDRYGGLSNIAHTAYTDPVGMATDASALFGGAEMLPGRLGEMAGTAARLTNPLSILTKPAELIAPSAMGASLPITRRFIQEYGLSRRGIGKVLLDEGIGNSENGLSKVESLRSGVAADKAMLQTPLPDVHPSQFVKTLDELKNKKGIGIQATPAEDLAAVQSVRDEFLGRFRQQTTLPNGQTVNYTPKIPGAGIEDMKQGTYAANKGAYSDLHDSPAKVQAQKGIAHDMKSWLEQETAGRTTKDGLDLRQVNQRDKTLAAAQHAIERRLSSPGSPMGLGALASTGLAASGQYANAALLALLRNPRVESFLARILYNTKTPAKVAPAAAAVQAALSSQRPSQ